MKTFKQFINENVIKRWDDEKLNFGQLKPLLTSRYSQAMNRFISGDRLYKGVDKTNNSIYEIDTSNSQRTSRDSYGYYQLLMDTSVNFHNIPSRSNSMICTGDYGVATKYGKPVLILPENDSVIAMASEDDFLDSIIKNDIVKMSVISLDHVISGFAKRCGLKDKNDYTADSINDVLSKFKPEILALIFIQKCNNQLDSTLGKTNAFAVANYSAAELTNLYENGDEPLVSTVNALNPESKIVKIFSSKDPFTALCNAFRPKDMGITLTNVNKYSGVSEYWFSGKCIMLPIDMTDKVIEAYNENV